MIYYRYLSHGKPIPKGWRLANDLQNTHHGQYAILIKADKHMANHPKADKHMANHPRRSIIKDCPKYLKDFRRKHKLSQKSLADKLQISVRVVENWEAGINKPAAFLKRALRDLENA